jgi:hypothetical protein
MEAPRVGLDAISPPVEHTAGQVATKARQLLDNQAKIFPKKPIESKKRVVIC